MARSHPDLPLQNLCMLPPKISDSRRLTSLEQTDPAYVDPASVILPRKYYDLARFFSNHYLMDKDMLPDRSIRPECAETPERGNSVPQVIILQ